MSLVGVVGALVGRRGLAPQPTPEPQPEQGGPYLTSGLAVRPRSSLDRIPSRRGCPPARWRAEVNSRLRTHRARRLSRCSRCGPSGVERGRLSATGHAPTVKPLTTGRARARRPVASLRIMGRASAGCARSDRYRQGRANVVLDHGASIRAASSSAARSTATLPYRVLISVMSAQPPSVCRWKAEPPFRSQFVV